MDARGAADLVQFLEDNGVEIYVDGGWAVDALLGEQTRPHDDLDVAIPHRYVPGVRALLAGRGFVDQPRDDTWECNFVLADEHGRRIDIHSYTLDAAGNNIFGVAYVRDHLTGRGFIEGYPVRCISPEWLVKFHAGYELDANDYHDVSLLCGRFGIALPDEFSRFIDRVSRGGEL